MYVKGFCPYCVRAKQLLASKGVEIAEIAIDWDGPKRQEMISRANGRTTVPQIFIGDRHVGGCDDLYNAGAGRRAERAAGGLTRAEDRAVPVDDRHRSRRRTRASSSMRSPRRRAAARRFCSRPKCPTCSTATRTRGRGNVRSEEEDETLAACRAAAREHGIWVHLGSLAVCTPAGKLANRAFVIDDGGEIRARYDKIHLFDVDLPTGESWRESAVYDGGSQAVIVDGTPVGKLGLTICYDLRFPALFAALTDAGAQLVAVPAAFTVPTGQAHWHVLLRARAIEAGVFVVAAAQVGQHEDGRATFGHSLVVGPWGEVVLDMGDAGGVAFADIDLAKVDEVRGRVPAIRHRRPIGERDGELIGARLPLIRRAHGPVAQQDRAPDS